MKKYIPYFITVIVGLIVLVVIIGMFLLWPFLGLKEKSRSSILKLFNDNQEKFKEVVEELKDFDNIYFQEELESYHICINNKCKKYIDPKDTSEYIDYKKTINLMVKLDIEHISKYNSVRFDIDLYKDIIYTKDINEYKKTDSVVYSKKLNDNWYYVETKR